jgi:hypothetical protein
MGRERLPVQAGVTDLLAVIAKTLDEVLADLSWAAKWRRHPRADAPYAAEEDIFMRRFGPS